MTKKYNLIANALNCSDVSAASTFAAYTARFVEAF